MQSIILTLTLLSSSLTQLQTTLSEVPIERPTVAYASTWDRDTILDNIKTKSQIYGVDFPDMVATLDCESHLNPKAIGDNNRSFGLAQIFLPAHPEVTKEMAQDPEFAITFTAKEFAKNNQKIWTCWRQLHPNSSR